MQLLRSLHIDRSIEHHDAAKGRLRVTRKSSHVGVAYGLTDCQSTGGIVLDNTACRLVHLLDHMHCSIYIQQVIVANLLAVEVVKALLEALTIVSSPLMRVFTIPHRLTSLHKESKTLLGEQIL